MRAEYGGLGASIVRLAVSSNCDVNLTARQREKKEVQHQPIPIKGPTFYSPAFHKRNDNGKDWTLPSGDEHTIFQPIHSAAILTS
jgi:hypothetical protein